MSELLQAAISAINLPFTIILGLIMLYWLTVLIGALDIEFLNIDIDHDVHPDVDLGGHDIDTHDNVDAAAESTGMALSLLAFLNVGQVPLMVVLSFLTLFLWIGSILGNYFFNRDYAILIALVILIPNAFIAILITKVITTPLKKAFGMLNQEAKSESLIGKICTVTVEASTERIGQAEVGTEGASILIHVKTWKGNAIKKGKKAVIFDQSEDERYYLIEELDDLDRDR
jgi:hypothetical protein